MRSDTHTLETFLVFLENSAILLVDTAMVVLVVADSLVLVVSFRHLIPLLL